MASERQLRQLDFISQFSTDIDIDIFKFQALAKFIGCNKLRTLPYHPQSNRIIERWHRTLKSALMCSLKPWTEILSTVLLGLCTSLKENIQASPAEMLYGTTLRVPEEFFMNADFPADPQIFVEEHREFMRGIRPSLTAHHSKSRVFIAKDLCTCSHAYSYDATISRHL